MDSAADAAKKTNKDAQTSQKIQTKRKADHEAGQGMGGRLLSSTEGGGGPPPSKSARTAPGRVRTAARLREEPEDKNLRPENDLASE